MDRRLLHYYNRELQHVRETAGEFAQEYPKIAGRLGLDADECADPYVERLLEGFAFLAARVHLKLDAQFPRLTQGLLETVSPQYLAPTPSMGIVRFEPDLTEGSLAEGFVIPRDRALRSRIGKGDQTACEYRTAHDVTLWPVKIASAEYFSRGLATLHADDEQDARAAIRFRLETTAGLTFAETAIDNLVLHLHGADALPMTLYEQLIGHATKIFVQPVGSPPAWRHVVNEGPRRVGFSDQEALLPYRSRDFHGYRLLQEYFSIPQRFMFVELFDLYPGIAACEATEIDVIVLLDTVDEELENAFDETNFQLFCTPAINLFPKRADRIHLSDRYSEFHVVPDRTRPLDYEVYEVTETTGYGEGAQDTRRFQPFYASTDQDAESTDAGAYFAVNRQPRAMSAREAQRGRRSSYAGSEVFVSLVDAEAAPYSSVLRQLGVETLCTNRDLPLRMPIGRGQTDFTMEEGGPVEAIRCISGPTAPRASSAEGEFTWRVISHLSLNYLSLLDSDQRQGAAALRDLLKLYGDQAEAHIRKQIDGVKSISHTPITRRVNTPGPIAFARGLQIEIMLDEDHFEGTGAFLLPAVLEQFFAKYVSINSFTETVVRTEQRGEIMRWPARIGLRQIV